MIFFYYGTDREKIQKTARATFEALQKKKPEASFVSLGVEGFDSSVLSEITSSKGLFEKKIVVKIADIFEDKEKGEIILGALKALQETDNIIVWSEGGVNKAPLEKIKKYAEKVGEFGSKQKVDKKFPSIFKLSDAIGDKDKKQAWQLFVEEFNSGTHAEEIHGTIFWQIKSILIAKNTMSVSDSGLNPYVYSKAKSFSKKWDTTELQRSMSTLVHMYHRAHQGKEDLNISIEKWILKI